MSEKEPLKNNLFILLGGWEKKYLIHTQRNKLSQISKERKICTFVIPDNQIR